MTSTIKLFATLFLLAASALLAQAGVVQAVTCKPVRHAEAGYTVCTVDAARETIRLFLNDPESGELLGSFGAIDALLAKDGQRLEMAMNAGMYHRDRSPVGLYREGGKDLAPLVTRAGPGNFGMLPNGVLCLSEHRAEVIESRTFEQTSPGCDEATQSGPMLVIGGKLHPRFLPDSDSLYYRNGVGVLDDGQTVYFAISDEPVRFYDFGTLFRDVLKTPNALYFDGNISRLYARELGRSDLGFPMGPIVGVVGARDD